MVIIVDKKYIIDRNTGGMPQYLTITDVIIAKNFKNNKYRKLFRVGILLYLYRNKIHPKDYLIGLDIDALKLVSFYFNVVILEKHTKKTIINAITPIIIAKLKSLHKRITISWDYFKEDKYNLMEWVRHKI